jgi:hypothetical protein
MRYELHPACAVWPEMQPEVLRELADDIVLNGLHKPLTLAPDGRLLDGRNRALACELVGVEPSTVVYDGDPALFSLSKNKHRRHMTQDQIALVAATLATDRLGRTSTRVVQMNYPPSPKPPLLLACRRLLLNQQRPSCATARRRRSKRSRQARPSCARLPTRSAPARNRSPRPRPLRLGPAPLQIAFGRPRSRWRRSCGPLGTSSTNC